LIRIRIPNTDPDPQSLNPDPDPQPCRIGKYLLNIICNFLGEDIFELAKMMQKNETFRGKREFQRVNMETENTKADLAEFIENLLDTGN
jgi:hypothetical protein